tara:strand:+ start:41 stop:1969 length:1929 start_codon:yes stop_codon:yes gene_type:complete
MNLKDLIEEINSALDYNPDLEAYKSQVARVINRHYLQVSSQYPWLFRQKTVPLTLRADVKSVGTIQVGKDEHYGASNILYFGAVDGSIAVVNREMLGNTVVIKDTTNNTTISSTAHGASEREFKITGVFNSVSGSYENPTRHAAMGDEEFPSSFKSTFGNCGVVVDRPITDESSIIKSVDSTTIDKKRYTDWAIEFRKYLLPEDCIEVLGMIDRGVDTINHESDGISQITTSLKKSTGVGRILFIDSAKEEYLDLDREKSGDPIIAIEGMPTYVTPPQDAPSVLAYSNHNEFALKQLTFKDTNGDTISPFAFTDHEPKLLRDQEYEYCYTFVYGGVESPPSPVCRLPKGDPNSASEFRYAFIFTEDVGGIFSRNGEFFPTAYEGLVSDSLEGVAKFPDYISGTGLHQETRYTGRLKRFYRRKVPSSKPAAGNRYPLGDVTTGSSKISDADFKSTNIGNRHQGNGGWMHIGDTFTDVFVIDIGTKQTSVDASFPHGYTSPPVLGWPEAYWMSKGQWTYHDGELQKIRRLDETGPRQSIRIYRPPDHDRNIEIRYLSRPKRLVANGDAPEWPPQYHHLLVYMALGDICFQHGMTGQAQLYERKADELLDRMKQKYLSRTNRKYVRMGFDRSVTIGERFGIPTKV